MMAIVYNNEAQAVALQKRVHNRLKSNRHYANSNERYAFLIHHPTNAKVAIPIELRDHLGWHEDLVSELTPGEIHNIEKLTSDWFLNDTI